MRSRFLSVATELEIDVAFQADDIYSRHRRVVVLDMDSTLVQGEIIDELAKAAGVGEEVAAITTQPMNGEIDFSTSFTRRLALLSGLSASCLDKVAGKLSRRVVGEIVDGERKVELLQQSARREGVRLEQVIAVGDGANDLQMLSLAGLGIAFRAKPLVRRAARQSLSTLGPDGILYLMDIRDREIMA